MEDEIDKIRKEFQQREKDSLRKLKEEIKQLEQELIESGTIMRLLKS